MSEPIVSERLELRSMTVEFIDAVLSQEREVAAEILGADLPPSWPNDDDRWLLGFRRKQMAPGVADWLVRAIVRAEDRAFIGHIGFHGPPEDGVAETGYTIFEPYRRNGYAEEAVRALFNWATTEHGVHHFRASVGPNNEPSLALVKKLGFIQTGVQWDERDGEELVFELRLS